MQKSPPADWQNETNYFVIISRLVLGNVPAVVQAVEFWNETQGRDIKKGMSLLVHEWFLHMDQVVMPTQNKLLCLALTRLLVTGQPWILEKLQDLMSMWTSTCIELREGDDKTSEWVQTAFICQWIY